MACQLPQIVGNQIFPFCLTESEENQDRRWQRSKKASRNFEEKGPTRRENQGQKRSGKNHS